MATILKDSIGELRVHNHLCLIYDTPEEQFNAVLPFVRLGLQAGQRCVYVADENTADEVSARLQEAGVDVAAQTRRQALRIITKRDAYLRSGYFDPALMIELLRENVDSAKRDGFTGLRVTGEMTWMLGGAPGGDRLIEYEAKLNYFFPRHDALAICQYNRRRFPPELIKEVILTHPQVIHGGTVAHNFYYIPPDQYLSPEQPSMEVQRLLDNIVMTEREGQERRRAEDALAASEAKFRALAEQSPLGVFIVREETFVYANPKLAAILNTTVSQLQGRRLLDFVAPEHQDLVRGRMRACLSGSLVPGAYAFRGLRAGGEKLFLEAFDCRTTLEGGPALLGTILDTTQHKQALNALEGACGQVRRALDNLDDVLFSFDARARRFLELSAGCERLTGLSRDALARDPEAWRDLIHPEDRVLLAPAFEALRREEPVSLTLRLLRPDGRTRRVELRAKPALDASGALLRVDGLLCDREGAGVAPTDRRRPLR